MSASKPLYERCEVCDGTRKTNREIARNSGPPLPVGSECPCCACGYHEIGMTDRQLTAMIDEREALLSLAARVASTTNGYEVEEVKGEALKAVERKMAIVAEYRRRKGLDLNTGKPPELQG